MASTRFYIGASHAQRAAVFRGRVSRHRSLGRAEPYSRRTGCISDLGAVGCGIFDGRDVCSPLHLLMNASFVVQGLGMLVGALLLELGAAVRRCPARCAGTAGAPGRRAPVRGCLGVRSSPLPRAPAPSSWGWCRRTRGPAGTDAGAVMYFVGRSACLLLLGWLWLRQTPLGWLILACGGVSFAALVRAG